MTATGSQGSNTLRGTGADPQVTRVVIAGATGKTGNAIAHGLAGRSSMDLVACVAPSVATRPTRPLPDGVPTATDLNMLSGGYDVLVDFTHADAALANLEHALGTGAHVVLGTTGIDEQQLVQIGERFGEKGLGLLYAPNFAIGAVLMMRFAAEAARYLPDVEIVELHDPAKRDAPSGTARRTAQLVSAARGADPHEGSANANEGRPSRGDTIAGISVHSVRLSGSVAHQHVIFGGPGQMLTISHDALDRGCYASGVALAIERVPGIRGLAIGLEHVL